MHCRFITYDEEGAIEKVFAQGRMHELSGKSVEVKRATPKGTGPSLGRGIVWRGYDQRADRAALEQAGVRPDLDASVDPNAIPSTRNTYHILPLGPPLAEALSGAAMASTPTELP